MTEPRNELTPTASPRAALVLTLVAVVVVVLPFISPGSGATGSALPFAPPTPRAQSAVAAAEDVPRSGRVATRIAILDRRFGSLATNAAARTPTLTASLVKVVVAVDIITRRRENGLAVGQRDLQLIQRSLAVSDDQAMNELWTRFDGMGGIGRVSRRVGLTGTAPPGNPALWAEATTTAADMVKIFDFILKMPPADRVSIMRPMTDPPAVAADGFAKNYGLLAPGLTESVAAKQGWMCCVGGGGQLHSTGVLGRDGRFVVALLGQLPPTGNWGPARGQMNAVARAIVRVLYDDDPAVDVLPMVEEFLKPFGLNGR
ncbi:serine hydrolase [Gordonia sp. PKS22-38]|uniref:Serine hydrolase n=1 Tax=Gordonia prachuapensis TaxID=3115651 RepID=A0ABU7MTH0_9ACTN|nr:serine hydrolase [Gordonia sp. PKS22-38]